MRTPNLPALLVLALVATPASAGVVIVDAQGGGAYTNLQSAATAAAPGDILLVRSGAYDSLQLNAKPLVVVADASAVVSVTNGVRISGLTTQQTVVLSGIEVRGGTALHALQVTNCQGPVRVDTCVLRGADGIVLPGPSDFCTQCLPDDQLNLEGGDGARVANSGDVSFAVCTLRGGTGQSMRPCSRKGGNGLDSTASYISAYDSTFQGGDSGVDNGQILGLDCIYAAARGATGARIEGVGIFASGSQFRGGRGAPADPSCTPCQGWGGIGMHLEANAGARLLDVVLLGGQPANNAPPGSGGVGLVGTNVFDHSGVAHRLAVPRIVRDTSAFTAGCTGAPASQVSLVFSANSHAAYLPSQSGVRVPTPRDPPQVTPSLPLGALGGSGMLRTNVSVADLPVGGARVSYLQSSSREAQGRVVLGTPRVLVVLDAVY